MNRNIFSPPPRVLNAFHHKGNEANDFTPGGDCEPHLKIYILNHSKPLGRFLFGFSIRNFNWTWYFRPFLSETYHLKWIFFGFCHSSGLPRRTFYISKFHVSQKNWNERMRPDENFFDKVQVRFLISRMKPDLTIFLPFFFHPASIRKVDIQYVTFFYFLLALLSMLSAPYVCYHTTDVADTSIVSKRSTKSGSRLALGLVPTPSCQTDRAWFS